MPYICLTQNVPDGIVNILDLFPNTSLRNLIYDPQGQTKYINRAQQGAVVVDATGALTFDASGVGAYLVDNVEPGGSATATGTTTVATSVAGNTVTIGGVPFLAVAGGAVAANQEFDDTANAGSDILSATSLAAAINDAASQVLIAAANGTVTATAANGGTAVVTLTASVAGPTGDLTLATNSVLTLVLSGAKMARANAQWTSTTLGVAVSALIARVDAGSALALADVNTILGAAGGELTGATSNSIGVLTDLLSVLAGRGYSIEAGAALYSPVGTFATSQLGGFTTGVLTFDTEFNNSPNGTVVEREVKPIRHTYDSGSFQESVLLGYLAKFADGVTLFPDSDLLQPIPGQQPQVNGARVLTVYGDDGAVLA